MTRLDRSDEIPVEAAPGWLGLVRFCLGMMSLGAAICLGSGAYACSILRDFGDNAKILGFTVPYSIVIPLLAVLCLLCAFAAIFAFFFPPQSSTES